MNLSLTKERKVIQWKRVGLSKNSAGSVWHPHVQKWIQTQILNLLQRLIHHGLDLSVKQIAKFLENNIGENLSDLLLTSFKYNAEDMIHGGWTTIKSVTSALVREWKDKTHPGIVDLQNTYLIKDFIKHIYKKIYAYI